VVPSVRLSPKASSLVTDNVGTIATLTVNAHEAVRESASVAVQVTCVEPSGKTDPDVGAHATVTGAWPFCVVGRSNVTGVG
jgi:hypothetical protein